jgi:hypothetical protein
MTIVETLIALPVATLPTDMPEIEIAVIMTASEKYNAQLGLRIVDPSGRVLFDHDEGPEIDFEGAGEMLCVRIALEPLVKDHQITLPGIHYFTLHAAGEEIARTSLKVVHVAS